MTNTAPGGFQIPFATGHVRQMPRLTSGPFRYERYADSRDLRSLVSAPVTD